jgi:hypothetical protein
MMIRAGRQRLRPPGPAAAVGPWLADAEAARLRHADLWYLGEDLCELALAATPTMPRWAPVPQDLPSETGFAVFATPISTWTPEGPPDNLDQYVDGEELARIAALPVEIRAVTWGPVDPNPDQAPAGACWMSFWSPGRISQVISDAETLRRVRALLPSMTVDNEAIIPWCPECADPQRWLLPERDAGGTTWGWASAVLAAFRLAAQSNLAEAATERTARPERRRTQRAGLPERDVRVVRLRRGESGDRVAAGESGREYHHRWVVRGHWRQQPWGLRGSLRRPVWILPHVRGPEGAPLLGGERVTVVGAPPTTGRDGGGDRG